MTKHFIKRFGINTFLIVKELVTSAGISAFGWCEHENSYHLINDMDFYVNLKGVNVNTENLTRFRLTWEQL